MTRDHNGMRNDASAFISLAPPPGTLKRTSPNEATVPLVPDELREHVEVVCPSRPSLTYDRME